MRAKRMLLLIVHVTIFNKKMTILGPPPFLYYSMYWGTIVTSHNHNTLLYINITGFQINFKL